MVHTAARQAHREAEQRKLREQRTARESKRQDFTRQRAEELAAKAVTVDTATEAARKRRDERAQQLALAIRAFAVRRHGWSNDEVEALKPYDLAADAAQDVANAIEVRRKWLTLAARDASEPFRKAVDAEILRLEVEARLADRALHRARVAVNREIRKIERARREGCADCP